MKKEIAEMWKNDLRANADKQGKNALCINGLFCCLGRLCELMPGLDKRDGPGGVTYYGSEGQGEVLPREVREWAGIKWGDGHFGRFVTLNDGPVAFNSLAQLNDNGMTFEEIADLIEESWEEL